MVVLTPASLKSGPRAAAAASVVEDVPVGRVTRPLFVGRTKSGFMYLVITPPRRGGLFVDAAAEVDVEDETAPTRGGELNGAREREDIMLESGFAMLGEM